MALIYAQDTTEGIALAQSGDVWIVEDETTVSNDEGIGFDFGNFSDILAVLGSVTSSDDFAVGSDAQGDAAIVYAAATGTISGNLGGVVLESELSAVLNEGFIEGIMGIGLYGDYNLALNVGTVSADIGVSVAGSLGILANVGTISSSFDGVQLSSSEAGLFNVGIINGDEVGVLVTEGVNLAGIVNAGTIESSEGNAIDASPSSGDTYIINLGTVNGDVVLGSGDDVVTNLGGTMGDIFGGGGNDAIVGTSESDMIDGEDGNDLVEGAGGNDDLFGDAGNDTVSGGDGDDVVHGGTGEDDLIGGRGSDIFVYEVGDGADMIYDLRNDVDAIDLTDWGFETTDEVMENATIDFWQLEVEFDFGDGDVLTVKTSNPFDIQDDLIIALAG